MHIVHSSQRSIVSRRFDLEPFEPRIMLSGDGGALVADDVPQIVVNYNDSKTITSSDERIHNLVGFYTPANDLESISDLAKEENEVAPEVATENKMPEDNEGFIEENALLVPTLNKQFFLLSYQKLEVAVRLCRPFQSILLWTTFQLIDWWIIF